MTLLFTETAVVSEWSSFPLSDYKTFLRSVLVCPTFKDIVSSSIQRSRVPGIVLAFPFYGCSKNC